jgi:hypothetical protein
MFAGFEYVIFSFEILCLKTLFLILTLSNQAIPRKPDLITLF